MPREINISASRISLLDKCSYKFYLNEILRLPEKTHPKTLVGSLMHTIFECLKKPRHRHHFDLVNQAPFDIYRSKAIKRLIERTAKRLKIAENLLEDVNSMAKIGLADIDFFHSKSLETFAPEHQFIIILPSGARIKGFIDDMARYEDKFVIRDYKSQKDRFSEHELEHNIQAIIYQLYVWETFKMPASVEFIMLRHPSKKNKPNNHIQIVKPKNVSQLMGLKSYLDHMYFVVNNYGLSEAFSNFCSKDSFCQYVCQFKNPFNYQSVVDKEGEIRYNLPMDQEPEKLVEGDIVLTKKYSGCPKFNK